MKERISTVLSSTEIDARKALTWVGGTLSAVGLGYLGYKLIPEVIDETKEVYKENRTIAFGTFIVAGAFALSVGDKDRKKEIAGKQIGVTGQFLRVAGASAICLGVAAGIDRMLVDRTLENTFPPVNTSEVNVSFDEGNGFNNTDSNQVSHGECEIISDFNAESAKQDPQYELDAMRLQYVLFERGLYHDGTTLEQAVDGNLGAQTSEAVDRLQASGGLDVSLPWNYVTCALVAEFMDGDPNTPNFSARPDLKFN